MPTLEEIEATVQRMEQRYGGSIHFAAYLGDRRDLALAKSAALMLIKQLEGEG
jgi:hypothetical protein